MPKQLLGIISGDTLIQQTAKRICWLIDRDRIYVVANEELAEAIDVQLTEKFGGGWKGNFIIEPYR